METRRFFRFPPDSPFREQRLAFQQGNPEVRSEPIVPPESPREAVAKKLKGAVDNLSRDPDVRAVAEQKMFELRANRAMKTAFENACRNRTFTRENGGNKYTTVLQTYDNKLMVIYNTPDGRTFVANEAFDVGLAGNRMDQKALTDRLEKVINDPTNFSEVLTRQINPDPDTR